MFKGLIKLSFFSFKLECEKMCVWSFTQNEKFHQNLFKTGLNSILAEGYYNGECLKKK